MGEERMERHHKKGLVQAMNGSAYRSCRLCRRALGAHACIGVVLLEIISRLAHRPADERGLAPAARSIDQILGMQMMHASGWRFYCAPSVRTGLGVLIGAEHIWFQFILGAVVPASAHSVKSTS